MKKQKDGYYHTSITRNGKKKQFKARTVRELNEKVREYLNELENNRNSSAMLFERYSNKWLEHIENHSSFRTWEMYDRAVRILNENIGQIALSDVSVDDMQQVVDKYAEKPRTAQILRMTARRIIKNAINEDLIYKNVAEIVILPKYEAKEKKPFSKIEDYAIKHALLDPEERLFVGLLFYTGMRRGEALGLSFDDINDDSININHSLYFKYRKGALKEPKTKNSKRTVPVTAPLKEIIDDFTKNSNNDEYLFERKGNLISESAYKRKKHSTFSATLQFQ